MKRPRMLSQVATSGFFARMLFILAASIRWEPLPVRGYPFCKVEAEIQAIYAMGAWLHRETGQWPGSIPELVAECDRRAPGWRSPGHELIDPWGHPYHWILVDGVPSVAWLGRDGRLGGEGANADRIVSTPKR